MNFPPTFLDSIGGAGGAGGHGDNRGTSCIAALNQFYHSPVVCNTYLEEGICGKKSCSERHPKKCRYWAASPKGCTRDDGCEYLHVKSGKYDSGESVTENQVSDCDDCQYEEGGGNDRQTYVETSHTDERPYNCDTCDLPQDNRDDLQRHRNAKYVVREDEEAYFATKGEDGRIEFTCKICQVSFFSQKDVKLHTMAKHGVE